MYGATFALFRQTNTPALLSALVSLNENLSLTEEVASELPFATFVPSFAFIILLVLSTSLLATITERSQM